MKVTLVKKQEGWYNLYQNDIGIGSTHEELQGYKLSLKNCQVVERGYDLDELAEKANGYLYYDSKKEHKAIAFDYGFKSGFQKALELMGDKKFSEDDVMLGWDAGIMSKSIVDNNWTSLIRSKKLMEHRESYKTNLKPISLQQTEWDVEIEMEQYEPLYGIGSTPRPKLDPDGCLILKRI